MEKHCREGMIELCLHASHKSSNQNKRIQPVLVPQRPPPPKKKQDKSSRGSVDTTETRSDPQRVRMSSGERPIGAAKGKQPDTEALCQPPPPPLPPTAIVEQIGLTTESVYSSDMQSISTDH